MAGSRRGLAMQFNKKNHAISIKNNLCDLTKVFFELDKYILNFKKVYFLIAIDFEIDFAI